MQLEDIQRKRMLLYTCIAAFMLAGLIHLKIAPLHYGHAPAHGIFFGIAGALEVAWALAFWRWPIKGLFQAGLALAGGLIVLWALTWILPVPFADEPGAIDANLLASKGSELIGVIALALLALQGRLIGVSQASALRLAKETTAFALIMGFVLYGFGQGMAWLAPNWGEAVAFSRSREEAIATNQPTLFLIEGGILSPIQNGSRVPLNKGLELEISVNPYPPAQSTDLDLYLVRSRSGEPVTSAQIKLTYQMQYMEHGVWEDQVLESGEGRYQVPLSFLMPGEWRIDISIQVPEGVVKAVLAMAVYP